MIKALSYILCIAFTTFVTISGEALMPRGPKGEKRPADVIGNAVKVMRIATGEEAEILDADDGKDPARKALGKKGGAVRAVEHDTGAARRDRDPEAAKTRWRK